MFYIKVYDVDSRYYTARLILQIILSKIIIIEEKKNQSRSVNGLKDIDNYVHQNVRLHVDQGASNRSWNYAYPRNCKVLGETLLTQIL